MTSSCGEKFRILLSSVLLLFCILDVIAGKCPEKCRCENQDLHTVTCQWLGLSEVPNHIPPEVEHLSLDGNDIKFIKQNDFKNLTKLRILSLDRNNIEIIDKGAFDSLTQLTSLSLSGNRLSSLPSGIFSRLSSLTKLSLEFNDFGELPSGLLSSLKNLRTIALTGNRLSTFSAGTFSDLQRLEKIELGRNAFNSLMGTEFDGLSSLASLDLSNNNISSVEDSTFSSLKSLARLHLDNNQLKTLPQTLLEENKKLTLFTIHNNAFVCNCKLRWLRSLLKVRRVLVPSFSKIVCNEPNYLRGIPLYRLSFNNMECGNGGWSSWSAWSICNIACGGGLRYRERHCQKDLSSVRFGCLGDKFQTEDCNRQPCVRFRLLQWSDWSPCSLSCGYGVSTRQRECINIFTGLENELCPESRKESKMCHITPCKIDGGWSEWSMWSPCSKTCGISMKRRKRSCTNPEPQNGGAECGSTFSEVVNVLCNDKKCVPQLSWTKWSVYSPCSATCGHGNRIRKRDCINDLKEPTEGCKGNSTGVVNCTAGPCPIDGGWSAWSAWKQCHPILCTKTRSRNCSEPRPAYGGKFCEGRLTDDRACDPQECFIYSQWNDWGSWLDCSKSCGGGTRRRYRKCYWSEEEGLNGEMKILKVSRSRSKRQFFITCGAGNTEVERCNETPCTLGTGTIWSAWGRWSPCRGGCSGKQTRKRACRSPTVKGGVEYCDGHSKQERRCQRRSCQNNEKETTLHSGSDDKCAGSGKLENGFEKISRNGTMITAEYSCKQFYKLRGKRTRTCTLVTDWTPSFKPQCVPVCGRRPGLSYQRARIIGGTDVVQGMWPWQVLIESFFQSEGESKPTWKTRCGGSLINDEWVVTAGHCLFEKLSNRPERLLSTADHILYFGVHSKSKRKTDNRVQAIGAKRIFVHPGFTSYDLNNDIALIQLKKKVQFTNYIRPVCLPNKEYRRPDVLLRESGYAVGWGLTLRRRESGPDILKQVSLPVVSNADCKKAHFESNVTQSMFCAGLRQSNSDTCKGDSGGGFTFWDAKRKKWMLQGVISWGGFSCGEAGKFSVYAKVARFTRWIKRVMRGKYSGDAAL